MEKIYRVQMNSKGMPNFSTAKEIPSVNMPIQEKCRFCPHCENCDVNDDLTIAGGSQEEVDAVEIYERAERRLERSEISIGEFESIVDPLRHLYYGRPQGEWLIEKTLYDNYNYRCSYCDWYETHAYPDVEPYNFCPNCGADMWKGVGDADE